MCRQLHTFILLLLCLFCNPALAAKGVVRGGEHDGFTRLTISTDIDVTQFESSQMDNSLYLLKTEPPLIDLDLTFLFDRLNAGRINSMKLTSDGLVVSLDCSCLIVISLYSKKLLVIDIFEDTSFESVALSHDFFNEDGGLMQLSHFDNIGPQTLLFPLDLNFVEAVSQSIARQASQNQHLISLVDSFGKDEVSTSQLMEEDRILTESLFNLKNESISQRDCYWWQSIWEHINSQMNGSDSLKVSPLTLSSDVKSLESVRLWVLHYLAHGLWVEARAAFLVLEPTEEELDHFSQFIIQSSGDVAASEIDMVPCGPLFEILNASPSSENRFPLEDQLEKIRNFLRLPIGLQISWYHQVEWLVGDSIAAVAPELIAHITMEKALQNRLGVSARTKDADVLAAVKLELRSTDFNSSSWRASFEAYLQELRYFDAIDALSERNSVSEADKSQAVSALVRHLVVHADSPTFLEISLVFLPAFSPMPKDSDILQVVARLEEEGFKEEAYHVSNALLLGRAGELAQESDVDAEDFDRISISEAALDMQKAGSQATRISVSIAQEQLAITEAIRNALSADLSR